MQPGSPCPANWGPSGAAVPRPRAFGLSLAVGAEIWIWVCRNVAMPHQHPLNGNDGPVRMGAYRQGFFRIIKNQGGGDPSPKTRP